MVLLWFVSLLRTNVFWLVSGCVDFVDWEFWLWWFLQIGICGWIGIFAAWGFSVQKRRWWISCLCFLCVWRYTCHVQGVIMMEKTKVY